MSVIILGPVAEGGAKIPEFSFLVPAGFPSPAADHMEREISLDELFGIQTPNVYLVTIEGDSMHDAGIFDGDLLVVDRSLYAEHGDIVIAALNAEPLCKRLYMRDDAVVLQSENSKYPPRHVLEGDELVVWGVVKYSVRSHGKA